MKEKKRLDILLTEKKLAQTRLKAQSMIMSGFVFVNGKKVDKSGTKVSSDIIIDIKNKVKRFVGRGGIKIEEAIRVFKIMIKDKIIMDIGAGTGGFTDCLLQYGAKKVYAIDVGYGQLDLKVRNDDRVIVIERKNIRKLDFLKVGEKVDLICADLSFISLTKISSVLKKFLKNDSKLVLLVKPQFELTREDIGKGGIVRIESKIKEAVDKVIDHYSREGYRFIADLPSPILGQKGNQEWLVYFSYLQ